MWEPGASESVDTIWADFLPKHEVPPLTFSIGAENEALKLAFLADPSTTTESLVASLNEFLSAYEAWIRDLERIVLDNPMSPA